MSEKQKNKSGEFVQKKFSEKVPEELKETTFNVSEFCSLKGLGTYHDKSLSMIFGKQEKTIDGWIKEIEDKKLVDLEKFK